MNAGLIFDAQRAHRQGDVSEAARLYTLALRADARNFDALYALGTLRYDAGLVEDAERLLAEAVRLAPHSADAQYAHARAMLALNRHAQALALFDKVLALDPLHARAPLDRANALLALRRYGEAVEAYALWLARHPDSAEAWHNRGVALSELKRFEDAVAAFSEALRLRPDSAQTWHNRGLAQGELKSFEPAASDHARALALDPELPFARGHLVIAKLTACDWQGLAEERAKLTAALRAGSRAIVPFGSIMICDSPADQRLAAAAWMTRHANVPRPLWRGERYGHERIRVAYVSGDFRTHPVAILMAGVFEHHDRARFETIGISFGPDDGSFIRARVAGAFDRFIDCRVRSDLDIAMLLRQMEADIAVDLMGPTADCRSGIFACRPAPVQVNYLGYPGTMASVFMDYIVADRIVLPPDEQRHYSEKIAYLPDTYFANDDKRAIARPKPTRAEAGLPQQGMVFCSFNNTLKFTPEIFAAWMRILAAVPGSVLWLSDTNDAARKNLAREAEGQGVASERIVFAPHLASLDDHLARLSLADLFLDTLPCNAHTTAADALWAGVPLLTCKGTTFAGRVAASLLHAVGLSELVTDSLRDYEDLAVGLACDPARRIALRKTLARNRTAAPLFDTARFTRNLEAAFTAMHARSIRGEPPQSFAVEAP